MHRASAISSWAPGKKIGIKDGGMDMEGESSAVAVAAKMQTKAHDKRASVRHFLPECLVRRQPSAIGGCIIIVAELSSSRRKDVFCELEIGVFLCCRLFGNCNNNVWS